MKAVFIALLVYGTIAEEVLQGDVLLNLPIQTKVNDRSLVDIQEWNSIVSLQRMAQVNVYTHACAGNILTVNFILSVAKCFDDWHGSEWANINNWRVRAGSANNVIGGVFLQLRTIVKHPNWDPSSYDNDISILRLLSPLALSPTVGQVILPAQGHRIPDGSWVKAAGWGATIGGNNSAALQEGSLQVINQQFCHYLYNLTGRAVTERMFCTRLRSEEDACIGDYGGPLVDNGLLYGLLSWGYGCVQGGYPGVQTLVSSFTFWIVDTARLL